MTAERRSQNGNRASPPPSRLFHFIPRKINATVHSFSLSLPHFFSPSVLLFPLSQSLFIVLLLQFLLRPPISAAVSLLVRPSIHHPPLESKPKRQRRISATPLGPRFFHPHLFTLSFLLLSPMFILIFVVKMLNIKMFMFSSIQFQVRIRTKNVYILSTSLVVLVSH